MLFNVLQRFRTLVIYRTLKSLSTKNMQVFIQKRKPLSGSTEWDVQHEDYDYHQEIARSAFADMLHDKERNEKYHAAIKKAIEKMHSLGKKANVLDIGTGTGLLSIMAAKCGADSIVACEAFKPMADCCLEILKRNNVADKITVIPKNSKDLTVGINGDLKQKANILVTEVFDTELIGEGALPTYIHAHKFLLEKDCIVVPDSAVVYAQLVNCPRLQECNKLNDLIDENKTVILRTPKKMLDCPGSASVHDVQLSHLPRQSFCALSPNLTIFRYNWSGKVPLDLTQTVKNRFSAIATGAAQAVFMWWELNMDPEGTIVLSCAPWWSHPDADLSSDNPEETIPWRDHWMQAVYYLPQEVSLQSGEWTALVSCQDEYSLWFYMDDESNRRQQFIRPMCLCGVHMCMSRTHVSYLNDSRRSANFLAQIKDQLDENAVVLDLNASSLMGLAAAKMGAKQVFIIEDTNIKIGFLNDYIAENEINNVKIISDVTDEILDSVTNVICDPNFNTTVLPYENLRVAYILYQFRNKLKRTVSVIPESFELWAMPVEFLNLHKIRVPLRECEGIDMTVFDDLIESSRQICDAEIEAQPLWEYPCICRGVPRKMLEIEMSNLARNWTKEGSNTMLDMEVEGENTMNGFVIWTVWRIGGTLISCGPTEDPVVGRKVSWDPHTRQAVRILKNPQQVSAMELWTYQVVCDLGSADFNVTVDLA